MAKNDDAEKVLLEQLKNPFDPKYLKWRVGATSKDKLTGIALAYLDAREVMKRFDEVMGVGNWQSRLIEIKDGFICEIDLWIGGRWVTKSNTAGYTKIEPIKGGGSDAFKRAAALWGVGRYLYYLPNRWVTLKQQGLSYVLAEVPELPEWALPNHNLENWQDIMELSLEADTLASADEQPSVTPLDEVGADSDKKQDIINAHQKNNKPISPISGNL